MLTQNTSRQHHVSVERYTVSRLFFIVVGYLLLTYIHAIRIVCTLSA